MNNALYINPLWESITFMVFSNADIITNTLPKNMETSNTFPKLLVELVDIYNIREIWCITGPGPFTLMRIITLSINALTYTRNIKIKSCHFFDLIQNKNIPIIEANNGEYLIRQNDKTILIKKNELKEWSYEGIFSENLSTQNIKYIQYRENQSNIDSIFSTKNPVDPIYPIYLKPPHITCQLL